MAAAEPHVAGHLYMQPPVCCGGKPSSTFSASQEQTGTMHRGSSAQWCPAVLVTLESSQAGGQQDPALPRGSPASCTYPGFELPVAKEEKCALMKIKSKITVSTGTGAYF